MNDRTPTAEVPIELGEEIGGSGRTYFENVVIDNLIDAVLELSGAVWTNQDRVIVLEKILAEKGVSVTAEIEAHVPDNDEIAARTAERDAFVERIFKGFLRRPTNNPSAATGA